MYQIFRADYRNLNVKQKQYTISCTIVPYKNSVFIYVVIDVALYYLRCKIRGNKFYFVIQHERLIKKQLQNETT